MRLTIFMKSGNQIHLGGVNKWQVDNVGDRVVRLKIEYSWWKRNNYLIFNSLDLSQIEAITRS